MDWKRIDWARRQGGPIEADLIEAYAKGKINRRAFVKRGSIIGLSMPLMGAVIASCGSDDGESAPATDGDSAPATDGDAAPTTEGESAPAAAGGDVIAGIQTGDANSGLDPVNMLDLGTYAVLSQSFEYLVGLGDDENIGATALATEWAPNDDGSQWTFKLREGVEWMDGSGMLTSADVAATIDRMVAVGAGLAGVVSEGATETPDDNTVVINLDSPNGNLPVLLSLFNPQSLITPVDYESGTVLNDRTTGTGAWMLDDFDATSFRAKFVPNPNWWGSAVKLDSITLQGFESGGTKVAAFAAGEIDVIQDFSISDGATLLDDSSVKVLKPPSANHRQVWFNTQLPEGGPFTDPRVRQAVCYAINRQQLVDTIYEGQAQIANDHPIFPTLPFFDETQEQRPYDPEMAKQLLADAGYPDGFSSTLQVGDLGEIPAIAAIVEQNLAAVGITTPVSVTPNSDFYGEYWCTGADYGTQPETGGPGRPCGASADIGIVDYGHRPTPDIFFGRALATDGDWNSSNYASAEFDGLFADYQSAVDVEGQKEAVGQIQRLLHEDAPACYPFFFNYLSATSDKISGFQTTALGHLLFQNATKS
ncbi:ABC transporter substrate-binding protein [Ilumatobacter coccineus]|jgi:peptide/nickel transport system substrate-binding protein|uniref:Putative oligopeptide ABC transporter oligopeptide-binding protein n=1 Tax=Ilumatobacter coccineus (strain NBRC 103263 / KCTC 29153 / YM16-304) TaxID=1313172 RepID=A0A6C7EAC1_ILUCY|nr:ABC transporter substrate-binding protein [Ilumatobacter coccineus]BAN02962.1 putative oligopeptide ABC transporter oligopeptide-binding protein [Ilumatobacter coccineus YM16-304]